MLVPLFSSGTVWYSGIADFVYLCWCCFLLERFFSSWSLTSLCTDIFPQGRVSVPISITSSLHFSLCLLRAWSHFFSATLNSPSRLESAGLKGIALTRCNGRHCFGSRVQGLLQADAATLEAQKLQKVLTDGAAEYKSAVARAKDVDDRVEGLRREIAQLKQRLEVRL